MKMITSFFKFLPDSVSASLRNSFSGSPAKGEKSDHIVFA